MSKPPGDDDQRDELVKLAGECEGFHRLSGDDLPPEALDDILAAASQVFHQQCLQGRGGGSALGKVGQDRGQGCFTPVKPHAIATQREIWRIVRRVTTVSAVAGTVVAALVLPGVLSRMRSRELTRHEAKVVELVENDRLAEAEDYLAKLKQDAPRVFRSPAIQKLQADWQAKVTAEKERRGRFLAYLNAAKKAGKADVESPTWDTLPLAKQGLQEAKQDLLIAEKLAASDEEWSHVKEVNRHIRETENQIQRVQNQWQRPQEYFDKYAQAELDGFLREVEPVLTGPAPQLRTIEQLIEEGKALSHEFGHATVMFTGVPGSVPEHPSLVRRPIVSANLTKMLGSVRLVMSRLNAARQARLEQMGEADYLNQITQALGDENAFRAELERYCQRFPETRRASSFDRVAKQEISRWAGIQRWDELVSSRLARDVTELGPEEAEALVAEITKLREEEKLVPEPEGVEPVCVFLDAIASRIDDGGSRIHLSLNGVDGFNNPTLMDLSMVKDGSGKRYYFSKAPYDTGARWSFYCFTGFDLTDTRNILLAKEEVANPEKDGTPDWTAPQAVFAEYALDKLARLNDGNWVSTFSEILARLHDDKEIEPILKVQLMQLVLEVACEGSHCLAQALESQAEVLETAHVDPGANWIDPDDAEGRRASTMAQQILDGLGDLEGSLAQATRLHDSLKRPAFGVYYSSWIGWLTLEPDGGWTCLFREGASQQLSGDLAVLHVTAEDAPAQFATIGQVRNGEIQLTSPAGAGLAEGRAVFVAKPWSP